MMAESESDSSFEDRICAELSKAKARKKYVQIKRQGECIECKQQKKIHAKQKCNSCYRRSRRQLPDYKKPNCFCVGCQKMKRHYGNAMCKSCYNSKIAKARKANVDKHKECKECKKTKFITAQGLCGLCYQRSKQKIKGTCKDCGQIKILKNKHICSLCHKHRREKTDIRMCKACGEMRPHAANQMCQTCYSKSRVVDTANHKECVKCGKVKPIHGHGMCRPCYNQYKKEDTTKHKECAECKQVKLTVRREMCNACYQKIFITPRQMAKRKLSKRVTKAKKLSKVIPKLEPTSDNEARSVSPIDIIKEECKPEQIDNDNQQSWLQQLDKSWTAKIRVPNSFDNLVRLS